MAINFTINGVRVEAEEGDSLLDTARRHGFEIPSLCHHEAITPYGACRLCLVEITKGGRKKITTSCNYEVLNDISVVTDSPEIRKHRAMVLELILGEVPENAHIKKLAREYGVNESRFQQSEDKAKTRGDCILCGLCARVCSEVVKANALTFKGRGDRREMGPPFLEEPKTCIGCGSCAEICPTDHIKMIDSFSTRKIWGREFEFAKCEICKEPVITVAYRDYAVKTKGLPADYYTTCAACKKKALAAKFSKVGS